MKLPKYNLSYNTRDLVNYIEFHFNSIHWQEVPVIENPITKMQLSNLQNLLLITDDVDHQFWNIALQTLENTSNNSLYHMAYCTVLGQCRKEPCGKATRVLELPVLIGLCEGA